MEVNVLYHHGIPGQKWGVRRYQRKDGSRTPEGVRNRKDNEEAALNPNSKKKSNYRKKLEEKYINKGLTPENAAIAANNRIRNQKILAGVGAVTVAAASAYLINKGIKERTDQTIKVGDKMQRIESQRTIFGSKDRNLHDAFYATNNPYDNKNYEDAFGFQKKARYGKSYKLDIEATSDIKVASQKKARDTFKKLLYEDDEFIRTMHPVNLDSDLREKHPIDKSYLTKINNKERVPDRIIRKMYDNYNSNLVGKAWDSAEETNRSIFYKTLKDNGYGAIQDINDLKWSKLRAKNPLIIFDKSKVSVKNVENIVKSVSAESHNQAYKRMSRLVGKQKIASLLPALAGVTIVAGSAIVAAKSRKQVNKTLIDQYKKEHPNTKMTDKEILKMYEKDK